MFDLTGKTVLITGGCGLLGVKHAEAILEFGGKVVLTDVIPDTPGVTQLKEKYKENISSSYLDVTDKSSIQHVVDMYDKIDILINNAGIASLNHSLLTTVDTIKNIYSILINSSLRINGTPSIISR